VFRRKPKRPEWASFFTDDEYARFEALVRSALDARGVAYRLQDGRAVTPGGAFGLVNLAQQCHGDDDWEGLIGAHFDNALRNESQEPPEELDEAQLRVRLVHPELLEGAPLPIAGRPLADLVLALAYDFPETIAYVREEDVARWGRPFDSLLEIGLTNVRSEEEPPEAEEAGAIRALLGDSLYTSTHALWVDDGLVAIPHRHAVLTHPLEDASAIDAINQMIGLTRHMFEQGPGSVSDQLYWKRGDEWTQLPVVETENAVVFSPPDDFVELLNGLAG
jgi:hypothetical protein